MLSNAECPIQNSISKVIVHKCSDNNAQRTDMLRKLLALHNSATVSSFQHVCLNQPFPFPGRWCSRNLWVVKLGMQQVASVSTLTEKLHQLCVYFGWWWHDCGRVFPDGLLVSSFPNRFPHCACIVSPHPTSLGQGCMHI